MNSKLLLICIIALNSHHHGYAMDSHNNATINGNRTAPMPVPKEAFQPSGLRLEQDEEICREAEMAVQQFKIHNMYEDTNFSKLENAATQALIANMKYINHPDLDPKTHPKDQTVMYKRFVTNLKIFHLTSVQITAFHLQTPEGLQKIEKYKKDKAEEAARRAANPLTYAFMDAASWLSFFISSRL